LTIRVTVNAISLPFRNVEQTPRETAGVRCQSGMTPLDDAGNQRSILAKLTAAISGETKVFAIGT
jgi:hypothetical protein